MPALAYSYRKASRRQPDLTYNSLIFFTWKYSYNNAYFRWSVLFRGWLHWPSIFFIREYNYNNDVFGECFIQRLAALAFNGFFVRNIIIITINFGKCFIQRFTAMCNVHELDLNSTSASLCPIYYGLKYLFYPV